MAVDKPLTNLEWMRRLRSGGGVFKAAAAEKEDGGRGFVVRCDHLLWSWRLRAPAPAGKEGKVRVFTTHAGASNTADRLNKGWDR